MKGLRPRLLSFLRAHQVLTLAAVEEAREPVAAALFYAVDNQLRLYVVTDPQSRHGRAMLAGGVVAGTVQRDQQQWHEIQGIQFRGSCRQLDGAARKRGWGIYTARFPFLLLENQVMTAALAKTALWRIEPDWVRLIDNRLGFGHREEWRRHRRPRPGPQITSP